MMEYAKLILTKVSAWENLFKKELLKCVSWVGVNEMLELRAWCYDNFNEIYPDILDETFANIAHQKNSRVAAFTSYSGNLHKIQIKHRKAVGIV